MCSHGANTLLNPVAAQVFTPQNQSMPRGQSPHVEQEGLPGRLSQAAAAAPALGAEEGENVQPNG